jgi:hypothetical protein
MFAVLVAVERGLQRSAVAASWVRGGEGGEGGADHAGRRGYPHHPTHPSPQGPAAAGLFIFYINPLSIPKSLDKLSENEIYTLDFFQP